MRFSKYHGTQNDFVFLADLDGVAPVPPGLVRAICDRRTGVGADGLIIEVHPCPEKAVSDGAQSLTIPQFRDLMQLLAPYIGLWKEARSREVAAAV